MAWLWGSEEKIEKNGETSNNNVNNNVFVANQDPINIHNNEIVIILYIICAIKIIEFVYFLFNKYSSCLKKKYNNKNQNKA